MKPKLNLLLKLTVSTLPLLLLTACCSTCRWEDECYPAPVVCSPPPSPPAVWQPDRVSAYSVGRTVDPRDPNVVHEAHTVYRREETSRPNLAPPLATPTAQLPATFNSRPIPPVNPPRVTAPGVVQEAQALDARLRELNRRSEEVRGSPPDAARVHAQIQAVNSRLEALDSQLRTPAPPPQP